MTADILRRAATKARGLAEAASDEREFRRGVAKMGRLTPKGRYMATMRPPVALAVADWLESTANDVEHVHSPIYNLTSTTVARARAVARAILNEPEPR